MNTYIKPYLTRDLGLGAYLKMQKDIEFLGIKQTDNGVIFFRFKDCPEIQILIKEYFSGATFISEYRNAIAELKSLIGDGRVK